MTKVRFGDVVYYYPTLKEIEAFTTLGMNGLTCLPAIVTAVWSDTCVNLKVIVDGPFPDLWRTSAIRYIQDTHGDPAGGHWICRDDYPVEQ